MANKIQVKRGTEAQLTASGPLAVGEPGYTTDTRKLFLGNGTGANTPVVTATSADITYYVRTDGNDNNTGLANTAAGAFRTIGKAISMIPKVINHVVNINVGAGTYAEAISLKGFCGEGTLTVNGAVSTRTVQNIEIINCTIVTTVTGFTCNTTSTAAVGVASSTAAVVDQINSTVSATSQPGIVLNLAMARVSSCVISNKSRVVTAVNGAKAYVENISGSGNSAGYVAELGSQLSYAGTQATSSAGNAAQSGGMINSEVINPWGDNTASLRSLVSAWSSSVQSFTANTWTKVMYTQEVFDNLGEYNPSLHRFTAAKAGVYLVSAAINPQSPGANATCTLTVYVNGVRTKDFSYSQTAGTSSTSYQGSAMVRIAAGDYIEIYAYPNLNMTGVAGSAWQYLDIVQIA